MRAAVVNNCSILDHPLIDTLSWVADVLQDAREPWWIMSSAAAALHGAQSISVGDVDVLLGLSDAEHLVARLGIVPEAPSEHPRFRSTLFARWIATPLAVEFMAGFRVRDRDGVWRAVEPLTRETVQTGTKLVFVPGLIDLRGLFERFGRSKDLERLRLLGRIV